jgi:ribosomal-protein-alanine N-acetyltransferase
MGLLHDLFGPPRLQFEVLAVADAPAVATLHGHSFARGWDAPEVARMLAEANVVGDALRNGSGHLIGFALSRLAAEEAELLTIAVEARQRGRGHARLLLDRHLQALARRGVGQVFLEVEDGNEPALKLYRRRGFRQVGERPGYYPLPGGGRARALVMRCDLE